MAKVVRRSAVLYKMGNHSSVKPQREKVVYENFTFACKDYLARLIIKLQERGIAHKYDDLNNVLQAELFNSDTETRFIEFSIHD